MKKKFKITATVLGMMLLSTGVMAGCKGGGDNTDNGDVKEVQIGVVSKGYGNEFANSLAEEYNKLHTDVKVTVKRRHLRLPIKIRSCSLVKRRMILIFSSQ